MATAKNKQHAQTDGLALFGGKTPKEVRTVLGIPADFKVESFLGVPIDKIPMRYLRVFLDGAVYEGRVMRNKIERAMSMDDELNKVKEAREEPLKKAAPVEVAEK